VRQLEEECETLREGEKERERLLQAKTRVSNLIFRLLIANFMVDSY